jgi:predicted nuclease with RNAse H fold
MLFSGAVYIGIDPTAGRKPFTYAALDDQLKLIALGRGALEEVLAFTAGQQQALVAVCAPPRPSQRLMQQDEVRERLTPPPRPGRWNSFRLAEYLLRQHGISCYKTPPEAKACPNWMQMGFQLYRRLEQMGYQAYPTSNHAWQWLEVYPHASYCTLLGHVPLPKKTLEGRIQRQLVLRIKDVGVPDPMLLITRLTRQRVLQGNLPTDHLYSQGELDALVAAYTAWQAARQPKEITLLGDASEGQVVLPVSELKRAY